MTVWISAVLLSVAAVLALVRIARGPSNLDRAVALDVLVTSFVIGLGAVIVFTRHDDFLPIMLTMALVGFVGSTSVALFSNPERGKKEEP